MPSRKDDKSLKIPYNIMIHLLINRSHENADIDRNFLSDEQLNNLSFELLLFYLMFTIAYLNINENAKIIKEREAYIKTLPKEHIPRTVPAFLVTTTALQAYRAYNAGRDFEDLFNLIANLKAPVKIHVMFISFLNLLYLYIIENNSIKSYKYPNADIKNLKRIIRKIFYVLINYTYESTFLKGYMILSKEVLEILKQDLNKALIILNRNNILTPFDCIEKSKCTKIEKLSSYRDYLGYIEEQLKKGGIRLERVGGCSACGNSNKKLIKRY